VIVINITWSIITPGGGTFLEQPLFYTYNFLATAAVIGAREADPERFDRIIPKFIIVATVAQLAFLLLESGDTRSRGTFTNPNQLAYWSVCSIALWTLLRGCRARPLDIFAMILLTICQFASLSRAGLGATAVALVLWAYFALDNVTKRMIGLGVGMLALFGASFTAPAINYVKKSREFSLLEMRLHKQDRYSSVRQRSLERIINHPENIVLGAGEGGRDRFTDIGEKVLEIHSSWGTMLFSYGILGFSLFLALLARIALTVPFRVSVHLVPSLIYSTTHNGLRFTFFWFVIGILLSIAQQRALLGRRDRVAGAPRSAPLAAVFQRRDAAYLRALSRR
jgi:hypothetical protein